jgi:prephenate dehydratase
MDGAGRAINKKRGQNMTKLDLASVTDGKIAFQGLPGAYSHMACRSVCPQLEPLPCSGFEDAFNAVRTGKARFGMIPIDNTVAGRVADIHHLLPNSGLFIIGEHFQRINHMLLAPKGTTLADVKVVKSHVHALSQCRKLINAQSLLAVVSADTAGAASDLAQSGHQGEAAIASELAADIYGLEIIKRDIEDEAHNTTRFIVMSRDEVPVLPQEGPCVTSFMFRVRNVPAALYKAMGGFATNGINMTKLESYMVDGHFVATRFYCEVEAHPADHGFAHALEELRFFSHEVQILGVYPAHPYRLHARPAHTDV